MRLETEDLDGLVTWTLIRAAHAVERELTALFAEHGLTPVQFGVLAHLGAGETRTSAQLAREVLVRPQSIAAIVDGLVSRELVRRVGERSKGRVNPIELTAAGQALLLQVWPVVSSANAPAALALDQHATDELNRVLHGLLRRSRGR